MSSNTAKVINEPQPIKWHCRERINAEIDDECLILLGKVFHAVITLGTKDEHIDLLSTGKRSNKFCMTVSTRRKIMSYKDSGRKIRVVSNNIIHIGEL